jgi:prepilin-type N-terminal cleavage/methylation domain-containing protein
MSDAITAGWEFYRVKKQEAFTLIEMLVVIAIIALLLAIIAPALRKVRYQARVVICSSNLRQIGVAIHTYANDFDNTIPFGPEGRPMAGGQFYTATGNVTSLISLYDGSPVGLGLMLNGYVDDQPKVLFCPGTDQPSDMDLQLSRVGHTQAEGGYYYRHASVALLTGAPDEFHIRLDRLGKNRNGRSISALAMDVQFLAHPSLEVWGVLTHTSHLRKTTNILFDDGQVIRQDNSEDTYTVDVGNYPYDALEKILRTFELADELH